MKTPGSLFLIGPMGAGKSTIGRQLSRQLGMSFHDSDREIERRTGVDIALIFELEGESGFRKRERAIIEELTRIPDIILATGGGAILDPVNRENLRSSGRVIYLHTSVDQQLARTAKDLSRPLLQTADPRTRLEELMAEREPLYQDIADLVIDTDGRHVRDVVKQILQQV
ncbi:MAG: shikimate kinase AroK [Gammaproteobacteria bacterium]|jgi:shikimate kinase